MRSILLRRLNNIQHGLAKTRHPCPSDIPPNRGELKGGKSDVLTNFVTSLLAGIVISCVIAIVILHAAVSHAAGDGWYIEGRNAHTTRIKITLINSLDFDRNDCPVTITRDEIPLKDIHEMAVTVVDPSLPARPMPSAEVLRRQGGHNIREETNGQQLFYQMDDLDKDGVWDELFFQTDLKARERKTMYLYIGFNQNGWMEHGTHAAIGSYCHHLIPFWESANVGWKLWYPDTCDVFGKRKPVLMSNLLYMKNFDGYGVSYISHDYGSDIQRVADSFGGGAICLFEHPAFPDSVSRPRFTPNQDKRAHTNWNAGPLTDTRYAYEVVVNGPVRSMIKAKTMNWNSGSGSYELEQVYTVYTNQSYSTCKVRYKKFLPLNYGTTFGCGIRQNGMEFDSYQEGNIAITMGKDKLSDPDDETGERSYTIEFVGNAIVVKDKYNPEYQFITGYSGNHTFRIPVTDDLAYEYMIFAAWNEGAVYNTPEKFKEYVVKSAKEYNNPVNVIIERVEQK